VTCFRLREDLEPEVVSGVPPDALARPQRWGNPLYNWGMPYAAQGYDWWVKRLRWATQTCDYIRLDHFRASLNSGRFLHTNLLRSTAVGWMVPETNSSMCCATSWVDCLSLPKTWELSAPDVTAIARWPANSWHGGLAFGFGDPGAHIYLPQRLCKDCVIYTGTHDNDTPSAGGIQI